MLPKVREAGKAFSAVLLALTTRQAKALEDGVPTAHVVRLRNADHYVYLSNEADVLREMNSIRHIERNRFGTAQPVSGTSRHGKKNRTAFVPAVSHGNVAAGACTRGFDNAVA